MRRSSRPAQSGVVRGAPDRGSLAAAGVVAALCLLLVVPPAAQAASEHSYVGAYAGALGISPMPQRVAVHEASGKAFVAARGVNRVQVLTPQAGGVAPAFSIPVPAPFGVAIDQTNGNLYVSHTAVSAVNERQAITTTSANSGTFTLTFQGHTTAPIPYNANGAAVQTALIDLDGVEPGDLTVSGSWAFGFGSYTVNFAGALAATDVPEIAASQSFGAGGQISVSTSVAGRAAEPAGFRRFNPNNATNPTSYSFDGGWTGPQIGTGEGQVGSVRTGGDANPGRGGLAVDPTNGDLIVADPGRNMIHRYDSSGTFVSSFDGCWDGSVSGFCLGFVRPAFTSVRDVAVYSNGDVLVADVSGTNARVDRYSATGARIRALSTNNNPVPNPALTSLDSSLVVGVNQLTDEAFISSNTNTSTFSQIASRIFQFENDTLVGSFAGPTAETGGFYYGFAVRSTLPGRFYGVAATAVPGYAVGLSEPRLAIFDALIPPTVSPGVDVSELTPTAARFSGTVNANGGNVAWRFQYRLVGASTWTDAPTPAGSVTGASDQPVSHVVSGLQPNKPYEVKLVANAGSVTRESAVGQFTTPTTPPVVDTGLGSYLTEDSALLTGGVNPRNSATSYHFEWGESTDYGNRLPLDEGVSVGSANQRVTVRQQLDGLEPGTTYHFRVVAENDEEQVSYGDDVEFTTLDQPLGGLQGKRGYELALQQPWQTLTWRNTTWVSLDGDAFGFALFPLDPAPPFVDDNNKMFVSERGEDRWTARPIDLPDRGRVVYDDPAYASPDFSRTFAQSVIAHDPDDTNNAVDIYMNAGDGEQVWLTRGELHDPENPDNADTGIGYSTGSGDLGSAASGVTISAPYDSAFSLDGTTVVFGSDRRLTVDDPNPSLKSALAQGQRLYRWRGGELKLISVRPNGTAPIGADVRLGSAAAGSPHAVSEDGSRIFWSDGTTIFAHVDGRPTATVGTGTYLDASADGRIVFYLSGGRIYSYDVDGGETHDLTGNAQLRGPTAFADTGERVYYVASAALDVEPSPRGHRPIAGSPNLYVTRVGSDGEPDGSRFVATLDPRIGSGENWDVHVGMLRYRDRAADASPDGRVLAFASVAPLLDRTTSGLRQVYVYDDATGSLECASCPQDGSAPSATIEPNAHVASKTETTPEPGSAPSGWLRQRSANRMVASDGTVFFTAGTRLVDTDYNDVRDVYEYRNGQIRLVSSGEPAANPSTFEQASVDGSTAIISSGETYDPRDGEPGLIKLWAARVGGGFPLPTPEPTCSGAACEGEPQPRPVAPLFTSDGFRGAGNVRDPRSSARVSVGVLASKGKAPSALLRVRVSGPGSLRVSGAAVRTTARKVAKAGVYRVRVPLRAKQRRSLAQRGKVTVRVNVLFRSSNRGSATRKLAFTLRHKPAKRSHRSRAADNGGRR